MAAVQVVSDEAVVPKKKKKDKTKSLVGEQEAPEGAQRAAAAARRAAPGSYDDMFRCVCQRPAACTPSVTSAMHTPPAQCWLNARTHRVVKARIPVKLMPSAISNVEDAVRRELTAMLLKLDPLLGGVPLTLSKLRIPAVSVPIFEDQPQLHFDVTCDFLLFAPQPGQMVPAVVNNVAEDAVRHARRAHTHARITQTHGKQTELTQTFSQVGLLILDTFNATIPRAHLEPDYEFDASGASWRLQAAAASQAPEEIAVGLATTIRCLAVKSTDSVIQVRAFLGQATGQVVVQHRALRYGVIGALQCEVGAEDAPFFFTFLPAAIPDCALVGHGCAQCSRAGARS